MNKLGKFKYVVYSVMALALLALPALAQPGGGAAAGDNAFTVNAAKAIGAGIGFGIAAGFAGIGQGLVGKGATEGVARNPGAVGLAGLNAIWSASTYAFGRPPFARSLPVSIGATGSPFSPGPGPDRARRSAFRRRDWRPRAQSRRPVCAIA